ncbi:hypothetical protein V6Z11_A10G138800 [Gossypium hirsutum]
MALKSSSLVIWGYVGIHSSGFRDFLLKPELFRSIVDSGFEHPSEAHLYVDKLCRSLGCIKSRLSFLHSLIEDARGKVDKEITTSHPSLCVIRGILQSKTSSSNSKVLILAKQVFWWSLKNLLMSMGLSWNELSSFCTNANPSGMFLHLFHSNGGFCGSSRVSSPPPKSVGLTHLHFLKIELDDSSASKSLYEGDIPQIAKKLTIKKDVESTSIEEKKRLWTKLQNLYILVPSFGQASSGVGIRRRLSHTIRKTFVNGS